METQDSLAQPVPELQGQPILLAEEPNLLLPSGVEGESVYLQVWEKNFAAWLTPLQHTQHHLNLALGVQQTAAKGEELKASRVNMQQVMECH